MKSVSLLVETGIWTRMNNVMTGTLSLVTAALVPAQMRFFVGMGLSLLWKNVTITILFQTTDVLLVKLTLDLLV